MLSWARRPFSRPSRDALELRVQAGPEIVLAYAKRRRVAHKQPQALEDLLDPPLARDLLDALSHHRPNPGPALNEPHALQLVVRLDDRVGRYRQLTRQPAHRRQPLSGAQTADVQRVSHLAHDLDVDRHSAARIELDPNRYDPHLFRVIVAYL